MFNNKPNVIRTDSIAVPPYDSKGNGIPTTGINPVTINIFNKTYKNRLEAIPKLTILPKILYDFILV